jgi:hypothetical protein
MSSSAGENKSIWFDSERLEKLDLIVQAMRKQSGVKISLSAVVGRAIDDLFLVICPSNMSDDVSSSQVSA